MHYSETVILKVTIYILELEDFAETQICYKSI